MKNITLVAVLAVATSLFACSRTTEKDATETTRISPSEKINIPDVMKYGVPYYVDPASSLVKWHGKKVTGEHLGTIKIQEGSLGVLDNQIIGGTIVMRYDHYCQYRLNRLR